MESAPEFYGLCLGAEGYLINKDVSAIERPACLESRDSFSLCRRWTAFANGYKPAPAPSPRNRAVPGGPALPETVICNIPRKPRGQYFRSCASKCLGTPDCTCQNRGTVRRNGLSPRRQTRRLVPTLPKDVRGDRVGVCTALRSPISRKTFPAYFVPYSALHLAASSRAVTS